MNESENKKPVKRMDHQYKHLAKNTLFSISISYGTNIFTLLTSFLIARMISREDWAIIIVVISIVGIFSIIINFLPPGLIYSMIFYIPQYKAKNESLKLRNFVLKAFYLRTIVIFVIYFIAITIFNIFASAYDVFLENHIAILYILSPLIIISNFDAFFDTFLIGFNLFRTKFILFIIRSVTKILPLLVYFFLFNTIDIETIALINFLSSIGPFILGFLIFITKIPKIKSKEEDGLNYKKFIKKVIGYGSFLRIEGLMSKIWGEAQIQAIKVFESSNWVTGTNISKHYTNSSTLFLNSLNNPLIYSLSSLDYKENHDKIAKMFKIIFNYTLFVFLFITGLLFFISDFFLSFIYGETYVEYSLLIKIMLVSLVFNIYPSLFILLLRTTNRIKLIAGITSIFFPLHIVSVLFGLINYGIYGMYIAMIIFNVIMLICDLILTIKLLKIRLGFYKMIFQYLSFFIAMFIPVILGNLIFDDLSYQFWMNSNLSIFKYLNLLNLLIYVIIFLLLNITFKIFTKSDLDYIEMLFTKDRLSHKYVNKLLRFLKRFLRREAELSSKN
ncbi:MAG: oligosaccharide flippase family protein [Candidatus Lokiarchaeota archaeon]|nr:oligosaccharide flippase family protein [Candidatus Lokiarchaeota archaeon]